MWEKKLSFSNPHISTQKEQRYHTELIALFNRDLPTSVVIGNIIGPFIFVMALWGELPNQLMLIWLSFSIFIGMMRMIVRRKLKQNSGNERYLNATIFITALGGLQWGIISVATAYYGEEIYLFFTTFLVLGMISGASSTLTPIYKSYIYYTLSATLPLIVAFLYMGEIIYLFSALLMLVYTVFVLVGGYKHYKKLYETILLKDKLKVLNEDLEGQVKNRTLELEVLNNSLEDKVQNEIAKNRDKDQQLLQQSRMAQMGEMISMIAHQWRQPLGAIAASSIDLKMKMAFSSFDLDKKEGQEECTTYFDEQLSHIEEYVQGLTTTIDDFRNFYKPNKEKKNITINEPIEKSLSIIQAAAKANGVDIMIDFQSQKTLSVHDSELMQVFLNIIKNSQDNFKEKGISEGKIHISTYDTPHSVNVEICDNGGGIPEAIMIKIFDPYFSTKEEKNGTGLGLYMSKTIIEEHHRGTLSAKNSNDGVCFTIMIEKEADENA